MTNMVYDLIVKGNVVLPEQVLYDGQIAIKDGKISEVFAGDVVLQAKQVIDGSGQYILPGAIDAHVHCYSTPGEGFVKVGNAAAAGGVTTVIDMPYDYQGMICTEEMFLEKKSILEKEAVVDMALLATIAKENGFEDIRKMAKAGACGYKVSTFNTDSFRFPRIDDAHLYEAFEVIAETGRPVGVHAENEEIVRRGIAKFENMGEADPRAHCWSRPKVSESVAILTVMELAYYTGVKLHLHHTTFPRAFELIDYYRSQGVQVTGETCTHYLTMCEDDMLTLKAKAKINPPLRSKEDMEGLWKLITKGSIDLVTSDHAPWTLDKKTNANIFKNGSGAPGVENILPIMYSEGVAKGRISILDLVRVLSENPAKVFGLDYCKGKICAGLDADLVLLDPKESYHLDENTLHSNAGWSPYHGMLLQGKITQTLVRGQVVYHGSVVGQAGQGKFIPAQH